MNSVDQAPTGGSDSVKPVRILLADDHALLRQMLKDRLQREPDLEISGTAASGEEAVERARSSSPDVVVMDIAMPGLDCFEAAKRIAEAAPDCRILMLSAFDNDHYIDQALRADARGYVTKSQPLDTIIEAIRAVAEGDTFFSDDVRDRIVLRPGGLGLAPERKSRVSTLTQRELEVLRYVANGLARKEIARVLDISPKTVEKHTDNIMRKLEIHDRVQLTRFAIREGLTEP